MEVIFWSSMVRNRAEHGGREVQIAATPQLVGIWYMTLLGGVVIHYRGRIAPAALSRLNRSLRALSSPGSWNRPLRRGIPTHHV